MMIDIIKFIEQRKNQISIREIRYMKEEAEEFESQREILDFLIREKLLASVDAVELYKSICLTLKGYRKIYSQVSTERKANRELAIKERKEAQISLSIESIVVCIICIAVLVFIYATMFFDIQSQGYTPTGIALFACRLSVYVIVGIICCLVYALIKAIVAIFLANRSAKEEAAELAHATKMQLQRLDKEMSELELCKGMLERYNGRNGLPTQGESYE
ncbi:hypothetical protein IJG91_02180 [Candidatus Saccharibacteria bacterium]|nr:hypothetical protein [Candidatus Saccharibacteria bacterium]